MKHLIAFFLSMAAVAALCLGLAGCSTPTSADDPSSSDLSASSSAPVSSSSEAESSSSEPSESSLSESALPESSSAAEPVPVIPESSLAAEPLPPAPPEPLPEDDPVTVLTAPPAFLGVYAPAVADDGEYLDGVERDILELINQERESLGIAPLEWDDNLAEAARIRAAELYRKRYTAHTRPNGADWTTVLQDDVPVGYASAGEILASISTVQNYDKIENGDYWFNQWKSSSAHYKCLKNSVYTHAGAGVVFVYNEDDDCYYGYACTLFAAW